MHYLKNEMLITEDCTGSGEKDKETQPIHAKAAGGLTMGQCYGPNIATVDEHCKLEN